MRTTALIASLTLLAFGALADVQPQKDFDLQKVRTLQIPGSVMSCSVIVFLRRTVTAALRDTHKGDKISHRLCTVGYKYFFTG